MKREQVIGDLLVDVEQTCVQRFTFVPGAETGFHVHEFDYVIVAITDCYMKIEDEAGTREVFVKRGEAYRREAGVAHNVINAGDAIMIFVEVEFKA